MKAIAFTVAALVAGALAQQGKSQSVANPPDHSNPGPGYYILQDIDYITTPGGNQSACLGVKSIQSKCYQTGQKGASLQAEWQCLCEPDSAYAVTQCVARNLKKLNTTAQDNYYQNFLDYTYDCYCGVTQYDVTYNRTLDPPEPFITGYTGDPILPPQGGCPAASNPSTPAAPKPPSGGLPPYQPPQAPCPAGHHRVNQCCVPNPPDCDECVAPKEINRQGKCVCPWYLITRPDGSCGYPPCPGYPLEEWVNGCYGGYCWCIAGYEYDSSGKCVQICPWGQIRDPNTGQCGDKCEPPMIPDYYGECICPTYYGYEMRDGKCVPIECVPPEVYGGYGYCYCPDGYYLNNNDECVPELCSDWTPECKPGYPGIDNITDPVIVNVTSNTPAYATYSPTMMYNTTLYTETSTVSPVMAIPPTLTSGLSGDNSTATETSTTTTSSADSPVETPTATPGDSSSDDASTATSTASEPLPSDNGGSGDTGSGGGGDTGSGGGDTGSGGGDTGSGGGGGDTGSGGGDTGSGGGDTGSGGGDTGSGGGDTGSGSGDTGSGGGDSGGSSGGSSGGGSDGSSGGGGGGGGGGGDGGDSASGGSSGSSGGSGSDGSSGGSGGGDGGSGGGGGGETTPTARVRRRRGRWN